MCTYIGLLIGSVEPDSGLGYSRIEGKLGQTLAFPKASNDYGLVTGIAVYDSPTGGEPLEVVTLQKPVDISAGIIPIVRGRNLLRGADVTARVKVHSKFMIESR